MDVLGSQPLEALVFNYASFGFLTTVQSFWTWVAILTAAVSFWRIRTIGGRPYTPEVQPPLQYQKPDGCPRSPVELSPAVDSSEGPAPACFRVCADGDDGRTKGKFIVYYKDDRDGEYSTGMLESWDDGDVGDIDGIDGSGYKDRYVCVYWEGMLKGKMGDLGWYGCQDITVLNGNVVRLWDGYSNRRSSPCIPGN